MKGYNKVVRVTSRRNKRWEGSGHLLGNMETYKFSYMPPFNNSI